MGTDCILRASGAAPACQNRYHGSDSQETPNLSKPVGDSPDRKPPYREPVSVAVMPGKLPRKKPRRTLNNPNITAWCVTPCSVTG